MCYPRERALQAPVLWVGMCLYIGAIYKKIPGPSMCSPRERALRAPVLLYLGRLVKKFLAPACAQCECALRARVLWVGMYSYLGWLIKKFLASECALRVSVLSGRMSFR